MHRMLQFFFRNRFRAELAEEIKQHIQERTDALILSGVEPEEAGRQARKAFGNLALNSERSAEVWRFGWLEALINDFLFAARILHKSPGFTILAVASLALAIGANTTIFSYANEVLFVRLDVPHPEQLRILRLTGDDHLAIRGYVGNDGYSEDGQFYLGEFPYASYEQLRRHNQSVEDIFAFTEITEVDLTSSAAPAVGKAELVSGNFYTQMQVKTQLGRPIGPTDDAPGAAPVVVISDGFWHRGFGGSPDVIGKTMRVNLAPATIIGVNPPSFKGPVGADASAPEVFLPLPLAFALVPVPAGSPEMHFLKNPNIFCVELMARAKPGISNSAAQVALDTSFNAAFRGTAIVNKGETVPRLSLEDGSRGVTTGMRDLLRPLYVLLGLAGLVLLLACANIANLMLARASAREREMSVRLALGAARARILQQVLTESLLLSAMGGFAGLVLGYVSRNLIPWLMRTGWDGGELPIRFDWRVFGFTCAATLCTGLIFGIAPAIRSTRSGINTALKEGSRTASKRRTAWSGKAIVGFQVALSTLLVISAVFFMRTLFNLNSINPGFQTQNLLLIDATPPRTQLSKIASITNIHERLAEAFATLPGIKSVTYVNSPLGSASQLQSMFEVGGENQALLSDPKKTGHEDMFAMVSYVGPNFFSTMSIPILLGRQFDAHDTEASLPVSIVNQALARKYFPNTNPIGKRFFRGMGDKPDRLLEIVGVCADTRYGDMRTPTPPVHFDFDPQSPAPNSITYIIHSSLPPSALVPSLRYVAQRIDPDLPISHVRTQKQQIAASMQQERMFASLTAGFGILALLLACVGIYGIMAYTVTQRTNEIGIRFALGATRGQIRALILREAGWISAVGVVVGLGAAIALVRLIRSMLFGFSFNDPISIAASASLLLAVALIAAWIPAVRAAKVEPVNALRRD